MGRIIQNLIYRLTADTKPLQKDLQQGEKQTKKFSLGSVAAFAAIGVGAIKAFSAIRATISQSIKDYGRQVQAEESLRAAVEASGESARDVLPQYKALASEIQELTLQGDEATLELIALATSMGVTSDQMEETTKGAIGLSDAFGISADRALRGLTEAFDGNFSTLQRYIPALRTASTESEKLEIVQRAAANGFEVSQARAETAFGALVQYENAVGDLREQLGQSVAEGIEPFVRTLTSFVSSVANATGETRRFRQIIEDLRGGNEDVNATIDEQIALLNKLRADQARIRVAGREQAGENLGEIEDTIAALEANIRNQRRLAQAVGQTDAARRAAQPALDAANAALAIQADAIVEIERRRVEALGAEEKQIENLQTEIDYWAQKRAEILETQTRESAAYRTVQQLITGLVKERDGLVESIKQEQEGYVQLEETVALSYEQMLISGEIFYEKLDALGAADLEQDKMRWEEKVQTAQLAFGLIQDLFGALNELNDAALQSSLDRIDRELQATLEANGLAEESKVERLEREKEAAIAEGDEELVAKIDRELQRTKLEEEAERERAKVRYRAEVQAWELQKLSTLAQAAQAALNAFSSAAAIPVIGFKIAPVAAAAAAAFGLARYQAVRQSKPTAPSFAGGGSFTVPPGFAQDSFALPAAFVQSGERVSVETAEQQALAGGSSQPMQIMVNLDGRVIAASTADYINGGSVRLEAGK